MMFLRKHICVLIIYGLSFLQLLKHVEMRLPHQEGSLRYLSFLSIVKYSVVDSPWTSSLVNSEKVDVLQQVVDTMGVTFWKLNSSNCKVEMVGLTLPAPSRSVGEVQCDCSFQSGTVCHVTHIVLKGFSLPGVLPVELVKLPYLKYIDFAFNYLNGTIPKEWGSIQLDYISLLGNRLSGEIPIELTNMTSLTYLNLEDNQLSGSIPCDIGRLRNLKTLILASNQLTGELPMSLTELTNMTEFRLSDNNFRGTIPDYIHNWKQLNTLELMSTGLEGPIPSNISLLNNLINLRIGDMNGPIQRFPDLSNAKFIQKLVLKKCNITGEIPEYIWKMTDLHTLDVSFNKLMGEIPNSISARNLKFLFLTGNMLSGSVPDPIEGYKTDLSYNNFTWASPDQPACSQKMTNINLFRSSSTPNNLRNFLPCTNAFTCPKYGCSLHVNCGGNDWKIEEYNRKNSFEGDGDVDGGSARYYRNNGFWGFSSSGDFMDDDNYESIRFVVAAPASSTNLSELYRTARVSPLSLTYFGYCLENGNYSVNLHFAEILFTNDNTYSSLGRRVFDIYIQNKLVWKDFNIESEAGGAQIPVVRNFDAIIEDNTLEIRLYWSSKGTTRIPNKKLVGAYGPLISAISVNPRFKTCSDGNKKSITKHEKRVIICVAVVVGAVCVIFSMVFIFMWRWRLRGSNSKGKGFEGLENQMVCFSLKQMKSATNNFDSANKIGEGGFGPVYKGILPDGTIVAVKLLSSKSRQGSREFLNEVGMISCLQHSNLVKLHGCCIEGKQLLLVYEYMENNSLASVLHKESELHLDWPTRFRICVGIAKGLAFLHGEANVKVVHRDIKATNVLLDEDLNPKISDFGLARLYEDEKTHVSTRIAGTLGYMAPEYALLGHLTNKADVYSFGMVALEIASGQSNSNFLPKDNFLCLIDWACDLQQNGNMNAIIDRRLGSQVNMEEARRVVELALLCTNSSPSVRPTMSEVVSILEGHMEIPYVRPTSYFSEDMRLRALRDLQGRKSTQSLSGSIPANSSTLSVTDIGSSSTSLVTSHAAHTCSKT